MFTNCDRKWENITCQANEFSRYIIIRTRKKNIINIIYLCFFLRVFIIMHLKSAFARHVLFSHFWSKLLINKINN